MIYWAPVFHFYQPPTQFPAVLRKICRESYRPLIDLLGEFDRARATVNINGALTEMLADCGHEDVLAGLRRLADDGRIELTGSAMYHPILPLLPDAVVEGASAVTKPNREEKRAILLLTDGEDTASRGTLDDAVEAIRKAEVPVYAIGIELEGALPAPWGRGNSLWNRLSASRALDALKRLTDGTGGWTYPIVAAKRCKEVCLLVADELRNQYLLGYYPTHETRDGRWRTIMVRTTRPGVTLTTRAGYYAAGT